METARIVVGSANSFDNIYELSDSRIMVRRAKRKTRLLDIQMCFLTCLCATKRYF